MCAPEHFMVIPKMICISDISEKSDTVCCTGECCSAVQCNLALCDALVSVAPAVESCISKILINSKRSIELG